MSTVDLTNSEEILTSEGAAKFLGIEPVTFLNKRCRGQLEGLTEYKIPNLRGYRYLKSDIISWMMTFKKKAKKGRPRKAV